ncbi:MAG: 4Fe-4S binding protein [Chloroflexota bacterium]
MTEKAYRALAQRLDTLPNGFPASDDGAELRLLELLYSPEEAELTAKLRMTLETSQEIAARLERDPKETKAMLKGMVGRGLIRAGKAEHGFGFGLLPFVVGIYEYQLGRMDAELAESFEAYYQQVFGEMLAIEPSVHRVIPVNETVQNDMEVQPFESATAIIEHAKAWGVVPCICRVQKSLIGDPCEHPLDVCMIFSQRPGVFDDSSGVRAQTKEESLATLKLAAKAGLVHSVSNSQETDTHFHTYICNCCTCSCGILRGMADLGIANVIARSAFVNVVDPDLCNACETCIEYCQFEALSLDSGDMVIQINETRCTGCGVCVPNCPDEALSLIRRPEEEIMPTPVTHDDWLQERADARGIDLGEVL